MTYDTVFSVGALIAVAMPLLLLAVLATASLVLRPLGERSTGLLMKLTLGLSFAGLLIVLVAQILSGRPSVRVVAGTWFAAPGYEFHLILLFDRLSLPFALLTVAVGGVVGVFASTYLHKERGFNRFFVMLAMLVSGLLITTLGCSIELVYAGWELVGLSSALLIAFFHERPEPVRNGLHTFVVYRGCDVGLLGAAVLVHHWLHTGDLTTLLGTGPWPAGEVPLDDGRIALIAACVCIAAIGKSAQLPFSGWLPRAMEGPTPSSAIFYGALSVHAGAYLLLRIGPLLDRAPAIALLVAAVGLATAVHATVVGRVQTDIKCALAYASLTQVGIIFVEIGLGWRQLALAHIAGHACMRSLQFLRAPSLLHDFHRAQNAIGGHLARTGLHLERSIPLPVRRWLYVRALERGDLDALLERLVARPVVRLFQWFARIESVWVELLGSGKRAGR